MLCHKQLAGLQGCLLIAADVEAVVGGKAGVLLLVWQRCEVMSRQAGGSTLQLAGMECDKVAVVHEFDCLLLLM
jgi:hypothetical protein